MPIHVAEFVVQYRPRHDHLGLIRGKEPAGACVAAVAPHQVRRAGRYKLVRRGGITDALGCLPQLVGAKHVKRSRVWDDLWVEGHRVGGYLDGDARWDGLTG